MVRPIQLFSSVLKRFCPLDSKNILVIIIILVYYGSPLAHLEPELELIEVWDDSDDDFLHHSLSSADVMLDICGYFLSLRGPIVLKGV